MRYTISLILASLALAGAARAEAPRVVTDLPAVHALVAQVMGDRGTPELLLDQGANAHSFQLRPSQAAALQAADLVVWVGPEMTPWLDRALRSAGVAPSSAQLRLFDLDVTHRQLFGAAGDGDNDHDHDHDHAAAPAEPAAEAGHDDHDHTGLDPHVWLDPGNARAWLAPIARALAAADPEGAPLYAANAQAAEQALAALDARLAEQLAPLKDRRFVVFHDAYGYFTAHYGLRPAQAVALGDAAMPGAARLADLRADLTAGGFACLLPEAQHDPALVQRLSEDTGVPVGGVLDPSGSTLEPGAGLYAALLQGIADTLLACPAP
ncbi:MAG: zinc ABC transporter substrate-binding protein [Rhodobacterales bacterium]|nr:zinc ABC transporter substrate-binding protein [Rhodobacterales bacterium]